MSTNKIALVTGGSRGLGKNAALKLAYKGIDVIFTYNQNLTEAEKTVAEIEAAGAKAFTLQLNTGDVSTFNSFFDKLKGILETKFGRSNFDFLVNNAGIGVHSSFAETTEADFDNLNNIHFKGVYFLTQKALPFLADGGGIVNLSTGLARFSIPGYSAYASMKGAIETLTIYLAKELGSRGIRVNAVAPGAIETDFNKAGFDYNPQMRPFIASQTALGRVGEPDDIGGIVAFLCTDDARWITAQRIEASGGMFI